MIEPSKWRENLDSIIDNLNEVAHDLEEIAEAATIMGNDTLSYRLWALKMRVIEAADGVKENKNQAFREWINTVNAVTKNMIDVALDMTTFDSTLLTQEQQSNES